MTNERYEREIREREIGKLATEAELRALRAQINPHFLFNALTTIGYLIQTAPPRALRDAAAADVAAARRAALGRRVHDARPRARRRSSRISTSSAHDSNSVCASRSTCPRSCAAFGCRRSCCSRSSKTPSSTGSPRRRRVAKSRSARGSSACRTTGASSRSSSRIRAPAARRRRFSVGVRRASVCETSNAGWNVSTGRTRVAVDRHGVRPRHDRRDPRAGRVQNVRGTGCAPGGGVTRTPSRRRRRRRAAGPIVPGRASADRSTTSCVVGEAASGKEAVAMIEKEKPDLALARLADAGARRHRRRAGAEEAGPCRSSRS